MTNAKRSMYIAALAILLLGVVTVTSGVWLQGSFSHGEPGFDQGCYCHNNGISIFINGTGDGSGGLFLGPFNAGSSFHFLISTNTTAVTGVVPGLQMWESNQSDNAKFTISPTQVTDGSAQDLSPKSGNITALYKLTAPTTAGFYTLTLYAQGSLMQAIEIQVTGGTTTTSTTTSTTSTTSSTTSTTSSTTSTTSSTTSTTSSTTSSSSSTSTHSTTSTTSTTSTAPATVSITSPSSGASLVGDQSYTISGTISPIPSLPDSVTIKVELQGSFTILDSSTQAVTASGTFSSVTHVGGTSLWVAGTYVITATDSTGASGTTTFVYSPSGTSSTTTTSSTATQSASTSTTSSATQTVTTTTPVTTTATAIATQTVTGPATTVTGPASTTTSTATATAPPLTSTQTVTQTATSTSTTSAIPDWAYGAMVVLLLVGLAIGYVVARPSVETGMN